MTQQELFRWKFGERIKLQRAVLGMSQTELAKKLGYSEKSAISKIENGQTEPPVSKVQQFADVLQTSVAYLMGWGEVNTLEEDEQELLSIFRQFQPETRQTVIQMLSAFLSTQKSDTNQAILA